MCNACKTRRSGTLWVKRVFCTPAITIWNILILDCQQPYMTNPQFQELIFCGHVLLMGLSWWLSSTLISAFMLIFCKSRLQRVICPPAWIDRSPTWTAIPRYSPPWVSRSHGRASCWLRVATKFTHQYPENVHQQVRSKLFSISDLILDETQSTNTDTSGKIKQNKELIHKALLHHKTVPVRDNKIYQSCIFYIVQRGGGMGVKLMFKKSYKFVKVFWHKNTLKG